MKSLLKRTVFYPKKDFPYNGTVKQIEDVKLRVQEDDVLGHRIIAKIKVSKDFDNLTVRDLRQVMRRQISLYKLPAELIT